MTERVDLETILARAEATPEGPWAADHGELGSDVYRLRDSGPLIADLSPELAEFIAAARTDVLEMAAELRALRHQLRQTTERERMWVGMAVAMADQSAPTAPDEQSADGPSEVGRLQGIIEGRHAPPTTEEIVAHIEACGSWLIGSRGGYNVLESDLERLQEFADRCRRMNLSWRWVAINVSGAPCEWPTVKP